MTCRAIYHGCLWRAAALAMALLISSPGLAGPKADLPAVLVPPIVGVDRASSLKSHPLLIKALRKALPNRIIDAELVAQTQKELRIWPRQLLTPQGVARLAHAVGAERALVVSASRRGLSVMIYASIGEAPTRVIPFRKLKPTKLGARGARRIAQVLKKKAGLLLRARASSKLVVDLGAVDLGAPAASDTGWHVEQAGSSTVTASAEILAEERREAAALAARIDHRQRAPSVAIATGLAFGGRSVAISGSRSLQVIPVESGALPLWSLSADLRPLRLLPKLNHNASTDLRVELSYQRGLYTASYEGAEVKIDDDAIIGRLSYLVPVFRHEYAPSLGLGVGGGLRRSEIGCCLAAPSTRYSFVELLGRASQPLWLGVLSADFVLAARAPLGQAAPVVVSPAWQTEVWLVAHLAPVLYARAGLRHAAFSSWADSRFALDERFSSLGLELGGYF